MSLRDGTKKMSKSDPSDYSRINLTDDATPSRRKSARRRPILKISANRVRGPQGPPEADNLIRHPCGAFRAEQGAGARRVRRRHVFHASRQRCPTSPRKARAHHRRDEPAARDPRHIDAVLIDGAAQRPAPSPSRDARCAQIHGLCRLTPARFAQARIAEIGELSAHLAGDGA